MEVVQGLTTWLVLLSTASCVSLLHAEPHQVVVGDVPHGLLEELRADGKHPITVTMDYYSEGSNEWRTEGVSSIPGGMETQATTRCRIWCGCEAGAVDGQPKFDCAMSIAITMPDPAFDATMKSPLSEETPWQRLKRHEIGHVTICIGAYYGMLPAPSVSS